MRLFMASGVRHVKAHVTEKTKPLMKESARFNNGQADELAEAGEQITTEAYMAERMDEDEKKEEFERMYG